MRATRILQASKNETTTTSIFDLPNKENIRAMSETSETP